MDAAVSLTFIWEVKEFKERLPLAIVGAECRGVWGGYHAPSSRRRNETVYGVNLRGDRNRLASQLRETGARGHRVADPCIGWIC
jgi:hypothetical protein